MKNKHYNLHTKIEIKHLLAAWKVNVEIPAKNQKVIVSFPVGYQFNTACIRWSELKGTYGDRLYELTMYNKK